MSTPSRPDPAREQATIADSAPSGRSVLYVGRDAQTIADVQGPRIAPGAASAKIADFDEPLIPLGSGGTATLVAGFKRRLSQWRALKRLHPESDTQQGRLRLEQEARLLARLDHPNIVRVHDCWEDDLGPLLEMAYIAGPERFSAGRLGSGKPHLPVTLEDRVERGGVFDDIETLHLGRQMCDALGHAHEKHDIIHRDIKPANILLDADERPILVDFGIGKRTGDAELSSDASSPPHAPHASSWRGAVTQVGVGMGTEHYAPPSQLTNAATADTRSDLYGLGRTMLFARLGPEAMAQPPHEALADLREPLRSIIAKATDVATAGGYSSARLMADDIERALLLASTPNSRRRRSRYATVLISAAALVVIAAWQFLPARTPSPLLSDESFESPPRGEAGLRQTPGTEAAPDPWVDLERRATTALVQLRGSELELKRAAQNRRTIEVSSSGSADLRRSATGGMFASLHEVYLARAAMLPELEWLSQALVQNRQLLPRVHAALDARTQQEKSMLTAGAHLYAWCKSVANSGPSLAPQTPNEFWYSVAGTEASTIAKWVEGRGLVPVASDSRLEQAQLASVKWLAAATQETSGETQ